MSKSSKQAIQSQKKLAEESLKELVLVFSTYELEINNCVCNCDILVNFRQYKHGSTLTLPSPYPEAPDRLQKSH